MKKKTATKKTTPIKKPRSVFGPDLEKKHTKKSTPLPPLAEQRKANPLVDSIGNELNTIIDPELGVGIVDLGLIYHVELSDSLDKKNSIAVITMTLTSIGCPVGPLIVEQIETQVPMLVPEIQQAHVAITWDPPWTPERMSPDLREILLGGI